MERRGEWLECRLTKAQLALPNAAAAWLRDNMSMPEPFVRRLERRGDLTLTGDRLRMRLFPAEKPGFAAEWTPLEALYEDDYCLVVNKPAGMAVHPAYAGHAGTLASAVAGHYEATGQHVRVRHIHRLDEGTSGPVLYAKNEFAQYVLDADMSDKRIQRVYVAVVNGVPAHSSGTIRAAIGKDRHVNGKRRVSASGLPAVTHYEVVEAFGEAALLRLELETGRTHQIRVHLAHIGHPIIGDSLYGGGTARFGRQALHGESLRFRHPAGADSIDIQCPLPDDIEQLIAMLKLSK